MKNLINNAGAGIKGVIPAVLASVSAAGPS